jgi:hypothetical protein
MAGAAVSSRAKQYSSGAARSNTGAIMRLSTLAGFAIIVFVATNLPAAENWPQWRGPLGTGVATTGEYPVKFSDTEGVTWKVKLPGKGSSTPAVWGDRIFVTCAIGESPEAIGFRPGKMQNSTAKDGIVCYDFQGKELWRGELGPNDPASTATAAAVIHRR